MRLTALFCAFCFFAVMQVSSVFGADMALEYGGLNIVLHDDDTWDYEDKNTKDPREPMYITLTDNRIIELAPDYSWQFVDKAAMVKNNIVNIKIINAQGSSQHLVYTEASAIAMNKAAANAATKLKAAVKDRKLNYNKLLACIKRVEKEVTTSENFVQGKGWNISIDMTLDQGSIMAVLDCEAGNQDSTATPAKK